MQYPTPAGITLSPNWAFPERRSGHGCLTEHWSSVACCCFPTFYTLGKHLDTRLGYVAAGFGYAACLGACSIGLQGLNQDFSQTPYIFKRFLIIHAVFSGILWGCCLVALMLFTIIFCRRSKHPASRFMALVVICWLGYLAIHFTLINANQMWAIIKKDLQNPAFRAMLKAPTSAPILSPWLDSHRPRIWWPTVFEWGLALSVLLWLGLALIFLWMKTRRGPPTPNTSLEPTATAP
jgi:hypothetical protein